MEVELIFNKDVLKLGDNIEYIKETANAIAILYAKRGYDYKDNVPTYLKASLSRTTKIKPTKVIKLLRS